MSLVAIPGRWLLAAAMLMSATAASAQSEPAAGLYVAEVREMASALELRSDGRFRWGLSYGALDMLAEGRWRAADGGAVLLDTEPPVRPPQATLLGAERGEGEGLVVRVADARGQIPAYLDVEGEYDSGVTGHAYLADGAYRFEPAAGRRIVAIRVVIPWAQFRSEPIAVPAGANVVRLSFAPNDLGRADFRGERARRDGDALVLNVLGEPIRYRRLSAQEQAEQGSPVSDIEAEAGAAASELEAPIEPIPLAAPVVIAIGEPLAEQVLSALPDYGDGFYATTGTVERLSYRFGDRRIDFGRVGGPPHLYFSVDTGRDGRTVEALTFSYQDRLLALPEMMERARTLETRLRQSGFAERPDDGAPERDPFTAMEMAYGAPPPGAADWDGAARLLADPEGGIVVMHLFTLKAGESRATVFAENLRRLAVRDGGTIDLPDQREWLLNVTISREPALIEAATARPGE